MPKKKDINKIMIIGSGPIIIGQACEFDYSGTQACKALRQLGYEIVLVNSNPATIMTDPDVADTTYIEPLNVDRLTQIIDKERPDALLPNLGGQSGLNLCSELAEAGVLDKYNVVGEDNGPLSACLNALAKAGFPQKLIHYEQVAIDGEIKGVSADAMTVIKLEAPTGQIITCRGLHTSTAQANILALFNGLNLIAGLK